MSRAMLDCKYTLSVHINNRIIFGKLVLTARYHWKILLYYNKIDKLNVKYIQVLPVLYFVCTGYIKLYIYIDLFEYNYGFTVFYC